MKQNFLPLREYNSIPQGDYLEENAAHYLAAKIRSYWARRGHKGVLVTVEPVAALASPTDNTGAVYCVRSNMVGGRPA